MKVSPFQLSWDNNQGGPWGKSKKSSPKTGQRRGDQAQPRPRAAGPDAEAEEMLRQAEERLRRMFGGGNGGGRGAQGPQGMLKFLVLIVAGIWLASGIYIVAPDEQGVVLRFGQYVQTTSPGLNYHLPQPIETVIKPKVERENQIEVGFRSFENASSAVLNRLRQAGANRNATADVPDESLMLTGDENIVDLDFTVRWRIADARAFLFNVADVPTTIKDVAESAMREVIGSQPIDDVLTESRKSVQEQTKQKLQNVLDGYAAGVIVTGVELQQVNPPAPVVDAFRDVQAARADAERLENEAQSYANDILPRARGEAAQLLQNAEAYKQSKIAEADGNAQRFLAQLEEYRKAPEVTRDRLYLETMEQILGEARTMYLSGEAAQGVLPYLPLQQKPQGGAR